MIYLLCVIWFGNNQSPTSGEGVNCDLWFVSHCPPSVLVTLLLNLSPWEFLLDNPRQLRLFVFNVTSFKKRSVRHCGLFSNSLRSCWAVLLNYLQHRWRLHLGHWLMLASVEPSRHWLSHLPRQTITRRLPGSKRNIFSIHAGKGKERGGWDQPEC